MTDTELLARIVDASLAGDKIGRMVYGGLFTHTFPLGTDAPSLCGRRDISQGSADGVLPNLALEWAISDSAPCPACAKRAQALLTLLPGAARAGIERRRADNDRNVHF